MGRLQMNNSELYKLSLRVTDIYLYIDLFCNFPFYENYNFQPGSLAIHFIFLILNSLL